MKSYSLFFLSAAILLLFSCQKAKTVSPNHDFTATPLENDSKGNSVYLLSTSIGHLASDCPNGCVYSGGKLFHVDCMGYGHVCYVSSSVTMTPVSGNTFYATTLDSASLTNEDFFNMPSRSLFVEYDEKNNEVWLNIPAQLVFRDSVSRQFTFNGLHFSSTPIYGND